MKTLKPLMLGLCLSAAGPAIAAPPSLLTVRHAVASWPAVPDAVLSRLRGGIDLSNLVAYFAIERVVEVNGQVVAEAQIVISNLDRLASGGLPTITVSGPLAQVVQIMNAGQIPGAAPAVPAALAATGAPSPPAVPVSGQAPAASVSAAPSPTPAAADTSGKISSSGTQSGSMAQFGSALASAVAAAASATSATGAGNATAGAPSASAATLASAQPAAQPAPAAAADPAASPAIAPAQTPANVSGGIATPVIVVSNLPNATAITTAVQNDVRATAIQTQTTITATLNSLGAVNGLALASAIQSQVASSVGH